MMWLLPLSWLYGVGVSIHRRARIGAPAADGPPRIVSIGNLEAGGSGKTPLAMWLLSRAEATGRSAAYVSRGYGARSITRGVVTCVLAPNTAPSSLAAMRVLSRSNPDLAREVGDEGAMVCERAPSSNAFFCADKTRALRAARELGVDLVVLDDAFQSWAVSRHVDIVLLDSERPLDGGHLLPVGRLREKPEALRRADALVMNGAGTPEALAAARGRVAKWVRPGVPVAGMTRRVTLVSVRGAAGPTPSGPLLAVSGIAKPDAFLRSLQDAGVKVAGHEVFRDHHRYRERDVARVAARMHAAHADALVTTEKDWMKLRRFDWPAGVWLARLDIALTGDELPV
jgi:tetraacyldisaccharide 4'-kinase